VEVRSYANVHQYFAVVWCVQPPLLFNVSKKKGSLNKTYRERKRHFASKESSVLLDILDVKGHISNFNKRIASLVSLPLLNWRSIALSIAPPRPANQKKIIVMYRERGIGGSKAEVDHRKHRISDVLDKHLDRSTPSSSRPTNGKDLFLFMNKQQPPDYNNTDHLLSKDNNASDGNHLFLEIISISIFIMSVV